MHQVWNLEKVKVLLQEPKVEENGQLEYKAAKAISDKDSISIDVSAFANAAGGVIIYGVKEFDEKEKRHLPEKVDPIERTRYSKEWLEEIINSNIFPRIENVKITPIEVEKGDEVIYVVEIPKGLTAHQAIDMRYYRRYNFQKLPMQDYEIRDVMNRTKHPEISLGFELDSLSIRNDSGVNTYLSLKVFIMNIGSVYANYVNVVVQIPAFMCSEKYYNKLTHNGIEMVVINGDNTTRDLLDVQYTVSGTKEKRGPARYVPVLPGRSLLAVDIGLVSDSLKFQDKSALPIRWKIYADNAEVKEGESSFKNIETVYRSM